MPKRGKKLRERSKQCQEYFCNLKERNSIVERNVGLSGICAQKQNSIGVGNIDPRFMELWKNIHNRVLKCHVPYGRRNKVSSHLL